MSVSGLITAGVTALPRYPLTCDTSLHTCLTDTCQHLLPECSFCRAEPTLLRVRPVHRVRVKDLNSSLMRWEHVEVCALQFPSCSMRLQCYCPQCYIPYLVCFICFLSLSLFLSPFSEILFQINYMSPNPCLYTCFWKKPNYTSNQDVLIGKRKESLILIVPFL